MTLLEVLRKDLKERAVAIFVDFANGVPPKDLPEHFKALGELYKSIETTDKISEFIKKAEEGEYDFIGLCGDEVEEFLEEAVKHLQLINNGWKD